ncbi:MAG: ABC transporter permease [Acidiferrobacteraceae bacterium]|jgi:peptide/nickel transport system permease protein|nr:ABC transporter permease [Acidiferrobacteraceae bacterium]MCP4828362.1 ABC transporter permease [Pseudomonadota bacterium]HJP06647.1 ABC transporter permease [Arenicellales bacterium]|tara:strand:- start:8242 stop:9201 length:960 start_codon:yes stop_codon:yes gene_type:complete
MQNSLLRLVLRRLALGVLTLIAISLLITVGVEALSGDVCTAMMGQMASEDKVAACHRALNLDRPVHLRYIEWLVNFAQGDMGKALTNHREVVDVIGNRIGNTFFLAIASALIAIPISLALGIVAALYRNSLFDRSISMITLSGVSVPDFFIAYILMAIFAVSFGIFPAISNVDDTMALSERIVASALPVLTLTLAVSAHMMRMTRASIVSLMASPYIEMAKLKGVKPGRIIVFHALPNAWSPIIQVIMLNLAWLVVGVVIVEVVFVYPGLGALMIDAVFLRDMPIVRATAMIFASVYVILNLLADILSMASNPRLMHPK